MHVTLFVWLLSFEETSRVLWKAVVHWWLIRRSQANSRCVKKWRTQAMCAVTQSDVSHERVCWTSVLYERTSTCINAIWAKPHSSGSHQFGCWPGRTPLSRLKVTLQSGISRLIWWTSRSCHTMRNLEMTQNGGRELSCPCQCARGGSSWCGPSGMSLICLQPGRGGPFCPPNRNQGPPFVTAYNPVHQQWIPLDTEAFVGNQLVFECTVKSVNFESKKVAI